MTPGEVEALFTHADGSFLFARWGGPLAPAAFGVDAATRRRWAWFTGAI